MRWHMFILLAALTACGRAPESPERASLPAAEPKFELANVDRTLYGKRYRLRVQIGRTALRGDSMGKRLVLDRNISVQLFRGRKEVCSVQAERGALGLPLREVGLYGGVLVRTQEGYEIEAEDLHWEAGRDRVRSTGFVKIISPKAIIYGDSLDASLDFAYFQLNKVRGAMDLE